MSDTIVTDNSAVIAALNERIAELEAEVKYLKLEAVETDEECDTLEARNKRILAIYHNQRKTITEQENSIEGLKGEKALMIKCLCRISNACIGKITMSYSMDAETIGQSIYEATGMTNPELNSAVDLLLDSIQ
jgi:hypothetical protein